MRCDGARRDVRARQPLRLAMALTLLMLATACAGPDGAGGQSDGETQQAAAGDDAVIVYEFRDSSVPPPYHRSERLTIDVTGARLVIDSYGDVLADESRPTPPELWRALVDGLPAIAALRPADPREGCVGGTGERVRALSGTVAVVELTVDECAGGNEQVSEAIGRWIGPARDIFPATEVLAPTG